jgi:hypothetical protein
MRIKLICGAVTRTFTMVALGSFFVSVDLAIAGPSTQEQLEARKCEIRQSSNGSVSSYKNDFRFYTDMWGTAPFGHKKGAWHGALKRQQELIAKNCPQHVQNYANKFFHSALKANEKSCSNKDSRCAEYNNWAQNLYEAAVKNGNRSFASTIKKYSSYVRNDTKAKEAAKKKAADEAAAKAKEEAENAAAYKAAEAFIAKMDAENAAYKAKEKADEAVKKKAAEDEAAEKQAAIDDAFSVFDITEKEAAAKIKAAKEKAAAQETKEDSSYILTNELITEMFGDLLKLYPQLADIKNIKIEKLTDVTQYKTITKAGIVKTIRCNPCSYHSATLQGLRTGMDLGMPKDIFDAIYNAINDEFGGERPINKSDMRKLIISIWKNLENVMATAMADPNFNIANTMTKEQIQQIKTQQRKTQANSNDNSGGSTAAGGVAADGAAEGHHEEDHHHEEEDPGVAADDPGDHYAS